MDLTNVLQSMLVESREATGADGGFLYLVECRADSDHLRLVLVQCDSCPLPLEPVLDLAADENSIVGYAVISGRPVNVADANRVPPDSPFRAGGSERGRPGYLIMSTLAVPMVAPNGRCLGVLVLVNKKRDPTLILGFGVATYREVVPFTAEDERVSDSVARRAAVACEARWAEQP